ncbi:CENPE [Mytilus coruscus]|uniref:CENPE n=1 Tax=Mytilus coruscus TaxID=42192 RepID=A0A6J8BMZ8_MYTCO|nr:CENPE [Mytilus coruscus]
MDNIKVAIRVRPIISREQKLGCHSNWMIKNNTMAPMENGRVGTPYAFDRIFDQDKTTLDIFEEICKPVITGAVRGFHGTIFAYGQSSSGKTFTMSGSAMQPGIISLSVEEIFKQMKNTPDKEFLLRISYMEIYNEKVSDLLSTEDKPIRIQEDTDRNIQLTGVSEELVMSKADVITYMDVGNERKHMAETKQNDRSSRSHCIMRMIIESRETGDEEAVMVSHLFASRAKTIKNQPHTNEVLSDAALLKRSQKEIKKLQQQIDELSKLKSLDVLMEKEEMEKKLEDKMNTEHQYMETINKLKQFIIKGSDEEEESNFKKMKRRRETWCPGKAKGSALDLPGGKFARDLNGKRIDVEFQRSAIPKSFVTSRRDDTELPDVSEMQSLSDLSLPKDDSLFMEFPPKFDDLPKPSRHVSFKSPEAGFDSPPFLQSKEFLQLQDDYENLLNLYEDKCKQSEQDHSYLIHELDFVKEELEKRDDTELPDVSEMQSLSDLSLPKDDSLFMEFPPKFDDLPKPSRHVSFKSPEAGFDSPPFLQSKEFLQLQDDYENLLNLYEDKCKQSEQDHSYLIHELDFVKEELEKEKDESDNANLVDELRIDLKKIQVEKNDLNINEEMQHQNETSLEMYIMKIQELEEKIEASDESLKSQENKISSLEEETKSLKHNVQENEQQLISTNSDKDCLQKEIDNLKIEHNNVDSSESNNLVEISTQLTKSEEERKDQEQKIAELEKEILHLYTKLKEQSCMDEPRRSTADELSDVLKEHCTDLENRLKEVETENTDLKEKLNLLSMKQLSDEPRRSTADELSDVLKEHCTDLENRLKEVETENAELKEKLNLITMKQVSDEPRRSTADELSDVLKEHCTDLENRLKEVETENAELKEKLNLISMKQVSNEPRQSTADELSEVLKEQYSNLENRLKEFETENTELKEKLNL